MREAALRGLRVPGPPAELRERVLRAANAAPSEHASTTAPWRAAWLRPRPELPWLVAASVLLLCHAVLFPRTGASPGTAAASASCVEYQQIAEMRQVGVVVQPRSSAVVDGGQEDERLLREAGLVRL